MTRRELVNIEKRAILVNLTPIGLMGVSGMYYGSVANSSAVVLDGLFSSVLFITVIIATFVSRLSEKPRNEMYPQGHWLLENLYILFKILVLLTIVAYSLEEGVSGLFSYFNNTLEHETVNQHLINYYYIIKAFLVVICYFVYTYYLNKIKNHSDILKLERKSVLIDGGITISIALGFIILSQFESTKLISDQIILTCLSLFLLKEVTHDFILEINKTIGKRTLGQRELYYKSLFNNYFNDVTTDDVYIHLVGKNAIVSVTSRFDGKKSLDEIHNIEKSIKNLMFSEFDDVLLYMYWAKKK